MTRRDSVAATRRADGYFDPGWLSRREPVDAAARSERLTTRAADWLDAHPAPHGLIDLGSGTGSNPRYLAPRLPGPQRWRLVDHDAGLLADSLTRLRGVRDRGGAKPGLSAVCRDLSGIDAALLEGADMVVSSALLDLVSQAWLDVLIETVSGSRQALLTTLNVDGDWGFLDPAGTPVVTDADLKVRRLLEAHQAGDKGFGAALGAGAPPRLARAARRVGYRVASAPSPWRLAAGHVAHHRFAEMLLAGWRDAALAQAGGGDAAIQGWHDRRLEAVLSGDLGIFVGHRDLLLLPPGTPGG